MKNFKQLYSPVEVAKRIMMHVVMMKKTIISILYIGIYMYLCGKIQIQTDISAIEESLINHTDESVDSESIAKRNETFFRKESYH